MLCYAITTHAHSPVDEKQGAIPNEEEEEEYGDDIHQLVCTLQSFVKEASECSV